MPNVIILITELLKQQNAKIG